MKPLLRLLSSVKLGVALLAVLMGLCVAGSIIAADSARGPDHARAAVFNTWWFLAVMGVLLVNLVLSTWERSYVALTLYQKRNAVADGRFYAAAAHGYAVPWVGNADALAAALRRRYTTVFRRGEALYAQKGLVQRTGFTVIHIGLIWTMAAGFYRILADEFNWGTFDATVILPEGQGTDAMFVRKDRLKPPDADNLIQGKMPFALKCLDFTPDNHPGSAVAKHFSALIELKDGDHAEIAEVTMREPLIYKGFKITQNSFSANDRVRRGVFQVADTSTGRSVEIDAGAGDPVKLPLPKTEGLFFVAAAVEPGAGWRIEDLKGRALVAAGTVEAPEAPASSGPLPVDLAPLARDLAASRYSFVVAALFPNFTFDENKKPTTKDEKFDNPAVLTLLFKNGRANGYAWLFLDPKAQAVIGQRHPEVAMVFKQVRPKAGTDGSRGLFDYEVNVEFEQKPGGRRLGEFWTVPGKVTEIPSIDAAILDTPAVPMGPAAATESSTTAARGGAVPKRRRRAASRAKAERRTGHASG